MPFGDANNSPIGFDAANPNLPTTDSGVPDGMTMEEFLQSIFDSGDGEGTLGNGVPAPDSTKQPEPTPDAKPTAQPTAPQDTPGEEDGTEGASGDGEAVAPSQADTPTPHGNTAQDGGGEAVQSPFDIIEFQGQKFTRKQAEALLNVYEWANKNPQGAAVMDAYMQGHIQFNPATGELTPTSPTTAQPTPTQPTTPTPTTTDPYAGLSPDLAERIKAIETIAVHNEQQRQRDEQARMQTQAQVEQAQSEAAIQEFQQKYQLTPEQTQLITNMAVSAQIYSGIRASSPDARSATLTALDLMFWGSPQFRDAEIQRVAAANTTQNNKQEKQAKLLGSNGGVGSVPRATSSATPAPSKDRHERNRQMAEVIAAELNS